MTYVDRIGEWWHPDYTAAPDRLAGVTIEHGVGGRVYASFTDGTDDRWGRVTAWEPGRRLEHSFTLAQDAAHPSQVSVVFEPDGDGCRMTFEHGGWTDANASSRAKFGDWPLILDRFVRLAKAG